MKKSLLTICGLMGSVISHAELIRLADDDLTRVVAQEGVDILLDVNATVGEVVYVDTAQNGDGDGGGLSYKDISIGGTNRVDFFGYENVLATPSENLDDLNIQVDALENGEIQIQLYPAVADFVDFQYQVRTLDIIDENGNATANLLSNVSLSGLIERIDLLIYETIATRNDGSSLQQVAADFNVSLAVDNLDFEFANSSLGVSGAFICGKDCLETMDDPDSDVSEKMAKISGVFSADNSVITLALDELALDVGIDMLTLGGPDEEIGSLGINDVSVKDLTIFIQGKD